MLILNYKRGFSLVEILIVVMLIGVLSGIAIYSYSSIMEQGRRYACIANLISIQTAVSRWAVDNSVADGTMPDPSGLTLYVSGGVLPSCPKGGNYTFNPVGSVPEVECSFSAQGHKVDD